MKTLHNTDVSKAKNNVSDLVTFVPGVKIRTTYSETSDHGGGIGNGAWRAIVPMNR